MDSIPCPLPIYSVSFMLGHNRKQVRGEAVAIPAEILGGRESSLQNSNMMMSLRISVHPQGVRVPNRVYALLTS